MKVSIIIPVYNSSKFIEETVRSVQNQTYQNFELIVVNDGSIDNTLDILTKLQEKDSRILIIDKPNSGVSDTRNSGIEIAKGEYVAFLDSDDIWKKNNLAKKIEVLESNKEIDWVYSNRNEIDEKSAFIRSALTGKGEIFLNDLLAWNGHVITAPSGIVVRRAILDSGIRFDTEFSTAADQDFCIQLAAQSKGHFIDEYLWNYRILPNSMSRNISLMEKDHIAVFKKAERNKLFYGWGFKQKCFANLYLILAGSWWVNGNNKSRAIYFIIKSFLNYPLVIFQNVLKRF